MYTIEAHSRSQTKNIIWPLGAAAELLFVVCFADGYRFIVVTFYGFF